MAQICTTIEQSNRLLDAGIRPDTATIFWVRRYDWDDCFLTLAPDAFKDGYATVITPAWDLSTLIEMMPDRLTGKKGTGRIKCFGLLVQKNQISYSHSGMVTFDFCMFRGNIFENAISCIEWLIEHNELAEEWLVKEGEEL